MITVENFLYMIDGVIGIDPEDMEKLRTLMKKYSIFPKNTVLVCEADALLLRDLRESKQDSA